MSLLDGSWHMHQSNIYSGGRGSEYQWIHLFSICIGFGGGLIMKRNLY